MADISNFLEKIRSAVYGEEVRGSIYDALMAMNTKSGNAMDYASNAKDSARVYADTARQYSGKPPKPLNGTWWTWDAETDSYIDTGIGSELAGPSGNGIASISLVSGTHAPGTVDIYRITMTDEQSYDITVYNGRDGSGTGDIIGIQFDLTLSASSWTDGAITVNDSRFIASSEYKYLVDAYDSSREEFSKCRVRPKDISADGSITFAGDAVPEVDITINVLRFELSLNAEKQSDNGVGKVFSISGSGTGDMLTSTYDPAGGARQVAFADEIGSGVTICTITGSGTADSPYVCDKTPSEINAAFKAGTPVYAKDSGMIYPMAISMPTMAQFVIVMQNGIVRGYIVADSAVTLISESLEKTANLVTALSADSTDAQYPSAKCVWDLIGDVKTVISSINGIIGDDT